MEGKTVVLAVVIYEISYSVSKVKNDQLIELVHNVNSNHDKLSIPDFLFLVVFYCGPICRFLQRN